MVERYLITLVPKKMPGAKVVFRGLGVGFSFSFPKMCARLGGQGRLERGLSVDVGGSKRGL